MKTFYSLHSFLKAEPPSKRFVITIGVFDGVHRAHQRIIKKLVKKAKARRLSSALITFNPHPANALSSSKKVPQLTSLEHRLRLLEGMGVDYVIVLRFSEEFARMSAADFIQKIIGKIPAHEVIVGSNFFFGRKKRGSLKDLKRFSAIYGYKVDSVRTLKSSGRAISSTWIRGLILEGRLKRASKLLSRPVAVLGTVIKGSKRGRILGYRTANIDPHHEAIPPSGVYAVKIRLGNRVYNGILNIGIRPTFGSPDTEPTIEAHIFGFNKRIYGRDLEIAFVRKIREEKRFENMERLRRAIERDEERALRILRP